jgi:hypothetical protein
LRRYTKIAVALLEGGANINYATPPYHRPTTGRGLHSSTFQLILSRF